MKAYRIFAAIIMTTTTASVSDAQLSGVAKWADSASREIEAGNAAGDIARIRNAEAMIERVLSVTPGEPSLLYYQALALYRQASLQMGLNRKDDAKRALNQADRLLETLNRKSPTADALALRSSITGQMIGLSSNPLAGMTMGPRANDLMDKAVRLGPSNPRVWLMRGMSAMFTPKMFGGGTDKAEDYLTKAIAFFDTDKAQPPAPTWGLVDAYIWLGQALQKNEKYEQARSAYNKALELQPENQWVTRVLLPSLSANK